MYGDPLPHRQTVRIADLAISSDPRAELITHALGSCIGVSAYDPVRQIGGLIHIMLPLSKLSPDKARNNPLKFVDTGVPLFFKELFKAGAQRDKLEIKLAGGAMLIDSGEHFKIGERNYTILRKLLWKNDLLIAAEDIGGSTSRTMSLFIESGRVVVQSQTRKIEL